jgi:putative component of toxin-antitoxin plasmid stabilization module
MVEIRKTDLFAQWMDALHDIQARARELIILLAGGNKGTQANDIKAALRLARNISE